MPDRTSPARQSMIRLDADEKQLAVIKRHPFGIIIIYVQLIFGIVVAAALVWLLLPTFVDREEQPQVYGWVGVGFVALALLMAMIALIATYIYRQSKLIVTDKTITQVLQESLFSRKISQLALPNVEDVTADRHGFFATIINYGDLNVETAGEQENFHFIFAPIPDNYAKMILEAREQFIRKYGEHGGQPAQTPNQYSPFVPPVPAPQPTTAPAVPSDTKSP